MASTSRLQPALVAFVSITMLTVTMDSADAYTCYSCSTMVGYGGKCCCDTCTGGGCASIALPDGNVIRTCDPNVKHGCHYEGDLQILICGCHEDYCNFDSDCSCFAAAAATVKSDFRTLN